MKRLRLPIVKLILGLVLVLGCTGLFFDGYVGMGEQAHAQTIISPQTPATATTPTGVSSMNVRQILDLLLKIVYIFLWPLLIVAGLALDNTLVYASIFHMDAPLWKFWNMMKNFANFTLGFMVLFAIIKSILTNSGEGSLKDETSPLGIIKNTLIAGILIQASRFLMAALVDVSTIATYAVGGLPLNVLKSEGSNQTKIIKVHSELDLDKFDIAHAGGEGFKVRYSTEYKKQKLDVSPCRIEQSYVIGREQGDPKYRNVEKIEAAEAGSTKKFSGYEVCVLFGKQFVLWNEDAIMEGIKTQILDPTTTTLPSYKESEEGYKAYMDALVKYDGWTGLVFITGSTTAHAVHLRNNGNYIQTGQEFFNLTSGTYLADIIKTSKGFVGPLVTIYSSLLNFSQLTDTEISSVGKTSGLFLIKTGVAIALFFPLLALAVVLIARIGILRLFIVASPFIVIKAVFSKFLKLGKLDEYLDIKSVLGIVFAPVVTVAALSLSLIFMSVLSNALNEQKNTTVINESFGIQKITSEAKDDTNDDIYDVMGVSQIQFSKLPRGEAMDRFSWLIINFFAIGLLWMIVFAAIKANALGKKIGGGIQSFGANVFKTIPILPVPGQSTGVGIGSMAKVLSEAPNKKIQQLQQADYDVATQWYNKKTKTPGTEAAPTLNEQQATNIFNASTTDISKKITKELGIKDEKVPEVISASMPNILTAISNISDINERTSVIKAVATAGNISETRYTDEIKNKLDALPPTQDKAGIEARLKIENNINKKLLDQYFEHGGKEYIVKTKDNKAYTITKNSSNNTYKVVP